MFDQQDKTQNMNTNKDKDGDKDIESCSKRNYLQF